MTTKRKLSCWHSQFWQTFRFGFGNLWIETCFSSALKCGAAPVWQSWVVLCPTEPLNCCNWLSTVSWGILAKILAQITWLHLKHLIFAEIQIYLEKSMAVANILKVFFHLTWRWSTFQWKRYSIMHYTTLLLLWNP